MHDTKDPEYVRQVAMGNSLEFLETHLSVWIAIRLDDRTSHMGMARVVERVEFWAAVLEAKKQMLR